MVRLKARVDLHKFMPMITFQFHMVRLKGIAVQLDVSVPGFQFHMVRLKDSIKANGNQEITFQFHMVRLKVYCWELLIPASCIISIPHGSIKRSRSPAIPPRFQRISIPHGTIKRRQARERILRQHRISIPHGTIKSLPSCS